MDTIRPALPKVIGLFLKPKSKQKVFEFSIMQTFRCPPAAPPIGKTLLKEWYDDGKVKIQAVRQ